MITVSPLVVGRYSIKILLVEPVIGPGLLPKGGVGGVAVTAGVVNVMRGVAKELAPSYTLILPLFSSLMSLNSTVINSPAGTVRRKVWVVPAAILSQPKAFEVCEQPVGFPKSK